MPVALMFAQCSACTPFTLNLSLSYPPLLHKKGREGFGVKHCMLYIYIIYNLLVHSGTFGLFKFRLHKIKVSLHYKRPFLAL